MRPLIVLAWLACTSAACSAAEFHYTVKGAKGEAIADAVVSLVPLDAPVPPPAKEPHTEISQEAQEYHAYVTVVQAGSTVYFPNKDTVQHHVYSLSKAKKFELPLYNPGQAESFVFDVSGLVTLGCNIHDWMIAYLVVVPTPWFAKSADDGSARIAAPAGRYQLQLWHPRLASPVTEQVTLAEGTPLKRDFSVTLKPERRIKRGPVIKNGGY